MNKHEISNILDEIGALLELKGENPFKSRAYYEAARTIESLTEDVGELVASGRILEYKGIGRALADKLAEMVGTGRCEYYEQLKRDVPAGLVDMMAVPGLGVKKIIAIWQRLGITTVGELEYACVENRLVDLPGFGRKTQDKIRTGIVQFKRRQGFHLYATVIEEAQRLVGMLRQTPAVGRVELVGDLRRRLEVVRAISILAGAGRPESVLDALRGAEGLSDFEQTADMVVAKSWLNMPVRVTIVKNLTGNALMAATGSQEHLDGLAARAVRLGVPWDLFGGLEPAVPEAETEAALYALLHLPFIEPELREGAGEIEAAERGELKPLVQPSQIQGVFHVHTTYSDGAAPLEEMVEAARALGYRYVGISDHSQSAAYANGLKEDRVRAQHAAIDALRKRATGISVLKGIEADILPDGTLDYPDDVLARFDFVIGSVHSRFNVPEAEQTQRVVRALANPHLTMLGHPTGRLLLSREGYRIDMRRVIDAAKQYGKVVEINANPHRLDLDWRLCRYAKSQGVRMSINPDAHSTDGLHDVPFGVNVARKGGLEPPDVVNTLGPDEIMAALKQQ